jgi:hypothetical protein
MRELAGRSWAWRRRLAASRIFSIGVAHLGLAAGGLRRCARSSQALTRSGEHHTDFEWSVSSGRMTGYMK